MLNLSNVSNINSEHKKLMLQQRLMFININKGNDEKKSGTLIMLLTLNQVSGVHVYIFNSTS